jgi:hypothetical protein
LRRSTRAWRSTCWRSWCRVAGGGAKCDVLALRVGLPVQAAVLFGAWPPAPPGWRLRGGPRIENAFICGPRAWSTVVRWCGTGICGVHVLSDAFWGL